MAEHDTPSNEATNSSVGQRHKRQFFLRALAIVVIVLLLIWGLYYFFVGRWYVETDDAYVTGNVVQISPKIVGTVVSITADDGALVKAGQVLIKLDPSHTEVALQAAKANLASTIRRVRGFYNNVDAAKAEVDARKTALNKAQADYNRRRGLAKSGAISHELLAHARDALAAAKSALVAAKQKYHNSVARVSGTDIASHPAVKAAEAKLRAAYLDYRNTRLIAPVDGYVAMRKVQVGEHVMPGRPLMAVVPLHDVWVDANFKETQLKNMRIGQPVELTSDFYGDDVVFHGKIQAIGIGTGSAFSLLPAENATGNWIKIVQRLPVRIGLSNKELKEHPLRIGLSMSATVDVHDDSGKRLATQPPSEPLLTTSVYQQQLNEAHQLIEKILAANLPDNHLPNNSK